MLYQIEFRVLCSVLVFSALRRCKQAYEVKRHTATQVGGKSQSLLTGVFLCSTVPVEHNQIHFGFEDPIKK